jgi:hypothetical protein
LSPRCYTEVAASDIDEQEIPPPPLLVETAVAGIYSGLVLVAIAVGLGGAGKALAAGSPTGV